MNEEREKVLRREHFSPIACAEKSARLFGEVRQRVDKQLRTRKHDQRNVDSGRYRLLSERD